MYYALSNKYGILYIFFQLIVYTVKVLLQIAIEFYSTKNEVLCVCHTKDFETIN